MSEKDKGLELQLMDILYGYTFPTESQKEDEEELFDAIREKYPEKLDHVVVVLRCQPPHYGHLYLLKQAINIAHKVTIVIGSANIEDEDNPFSYKKRYQILLKTLHRERMLPFIEQIIPVNDEDNDDEWLEKILTRTDEVDAVVGNNPWVNGIFQKAGIEAIEIPLLNRGRLKGATIRTELRGKRLLP